MIAEDVKSVNTLLAMGAALEARDGAAGETALHLAAVQGCDEIVYALLNAGADPLCPDASGGWTPLHAAARVRNPAAHTAFSLRKRSRLTAGCCGRQADQPAIVEVLIEAASPLHIDTRAASGDTALHRASLWGCHRAVSLLLGAGADPEARNAAGQRPRDVVCAHGCAPLKHQREVEEAFAA